jgi:hypothetical protein
MSGMPRLMLVGLAIVALGGGADVVHHALPLTAAPLMAPYLGHDGGAAHAVTLGGMVVTMLGVLTRASKQRAT